MDLSELDLRLLNRIQQDFPLEARPFAALGDALGVDEATVMERMAHLRQTKVLRQVSAIMDTRSLGYKSSLVAARFPDDRVNEGAAVINTHPGVSHNYKRNHEFNVWYTIAVPPASSLEQCVERLKELSGAEAMRLMPTLRLFKIGVKLDMTGEGDPTGHSEPDYSEEQREKALSIPLTEQDIAVIREIQEDIPLEPEPFRPMAERLGMSQEDLFAHARSLQEAGHMRRYAAILYHRTAGFAANAMAVWKVPEDRVLDVGRHMASFNVVSHCYQRPVYPDWPYPLFAMIHARKVKDCQAMAARMSEEVGIPEYALLYSTKEYKKTRVRYYTSDYDDWEAKYLG